MYVWNIQHPIHQNSSHVKLCLSKSIILESNIFAERNVCKISISRFRKQEFFFAKHVYWIQPLRCTAKLCKAYVIYLVLNERFDTMMYKNASTYITVTYVYEIYTAHFFSEGYLSVLNHRGLFYRSFYCQNSDILEVKIMLLNKSKNFKGCTQRNFTLVLFEVLLTINHSINSNIT